MGENIHQTCLIINWHLGCIKNYYNLTNTLKKNLNFQNEEITWKDTSLKQEIQMSKNLRRTCSTSFVIREKQIEIPTTYQFIPIRMTKIFKLTIQNLREDVEPLELSYILGKKVLSGKEFTCQCRRHGFDSWALTVVPSGL